jgi:Bacterial TniB protein
MSAVSPFYGEARSGKSSLSALFKDRYPIERTAEGVQAPVLAVCMPTAPTVKALSEIILKTLGDPQHGKGTQGTLEDRARDLAKRCGVRMMFIEEFHQVFNPGRDNYMYNFGEFLKNFSEHSGALLVPVGLPHGEYAIKKNEQLTGRMTAPIRLPRFNWGDEDSREEFIAILAAMHESIGRYFKIPEIESERIAFMFYCATGGMIGYIAKILDKVVRTAVSKKTFSIKIENLATAHSRCMDPNDFAVRGCSPFDARFKPKVDEQMMARVAKIGVRPEDAPNGYVKTRRNRPIRDLAIVTEV